MTNPLATRPTPGAPRAYHFPGGTKQRLATGATVVTATMGRLPLASIGVLIRHGGAADEARGRDGTAHFVSSMLLEGAGQLDGAAIAERFEDLGTTVVSAADWDGATLSATVHSSKLERVVELLRDLLQRPTFPAREMERLREEHRAERLQLVAEPRSLADAAFGLVCYAVDSRYRRPLGGTIESVGALTREHIVAHWTQRYGPSELTVVLAGDVSPERGAACATLLSGEWNAETTAPTASESGEAAAGSGVHLVAKRDAAQCELRVGHVGVPRHHPDYFPLTVMNAILGGLFSSRINLNLRERHGYTYGAHSGFDWRRGPGPFVVSTAVNTDAAGPATREILSEIERIRNDLVTPDELSLATSYLAGVFPLRFETTGAVASALMMQETFELEADYFDRYREAVAAVTREEVLRVAQDHLHPDQLQIVAVGEPGALKPALDELGRGEVRMYEPDQIEAAK